MNETDAQPAPLPPAVAAYVQEHTRIYVGTGIAYAIDECGYARFHSSRDGCPNWSTDDLVEWTRKYRPELWTEYL